MYSILLSLLFLFHCSSLTQGSRFDSTIVRGRVHLRPSCRPYQAEIFQAVRSVKTLVKAGKDEIRKPSIIGIPDEAPSWYAYYFGDSFDNRRFVNNVFDTILKALNQEELYFTCLSCVPGQGPTSKTASPNHINLCQAALFEEMLVPLDHYSFCSFFLDPSLATIILWDMLIKQPFGHHKLLQGSDDIQLARMIARGEVYNEEGTDALDPAFVATNYVFMVQSAVKWKYITAGKCKEWKRFESTWIKANAIDRPTGIAGAEETGPIFAGGDRDELRRKLLKAHQVASGAGD